MLVVLVVLVVVTAAAVVAAAAAVVKRYEYVVATHASSPLLHHHGTRTQVVRTQVNLGDATAAASAFVENFRSSAPYMHMHAGEIMVVHISSALRGTPEFDTLLDDLGLIRLLGVRLVLVMSTRRQVDARLNELNMPLAYREGFRVTDEATLEVVKEVNGAIRTEVEARMSRALRAPRGVQHNKANVLSSNIFFRANPVGVRNGIDFMWSGEVRRVDAPAMLRWLEAGDVLLLTPVGFGLRYLCCVCADACVRACELH